MDCGFNNTFTEWCKSSSLTRREASTSLPPPQPAHILLVGLAETETEEKVILQICAVPAAVRQKEGAKRTAEPSLREQAEQIPGRELQFYHFLAGEMGSSHFPSLGLFPIPGG